MLSKWIKSEDGLSVKRNFFLGLIYSKLDFLNGFDIRLIFCYEHPPVAGWEKKFSWDTWAGYFYFLFTHVYLCCYTFNIDDAAKGVVKTQTLLQILMTFQVEVVSYVMKYKMPK